MIRACTRPQVRPGAASQGKGLARAGLRLCRARSRSLDQHIHRAGNTGLARYYDIGKGPVPEWRTTAAIIPM